ncbi:hypothetical protein W97_08542 [Coniosporium apollinis CBS 100218]|uniref:PHD-type domain-containing protein n=1 Tax=Coniosporium apollinis (strain CBS 100218) TaxID=1168221 RepID=R7Z5A2_CONA1|nr:uncharacterized protein W97_08542 [Coniosporium apollinis CBS 100218]EON69184.1 hypothetical protein W97_08542 [Coniosporium apollinis CBS 100218]
MSATVSSAPSQSQTPNASTSRPRPRRPRRNPADRPPPTEGQGDPQQLPSNSGRGGRAQPARDALLAMRPASIAPPRQTQSQPQSAEPSSADVSAAESPRPSRGGRRRGGRGPRPDGEPPRSDDARPQQRGHAGQNVNTSRTFQGRQFGGQLTVDSSEAGGISGLSTAAASQLSGEAPEFQPGQSHQRTTPRPPRERLPQPRKRRASKSTAPDIPTRIHEDIDNLQYECAICTNEVTRNSKAWSCRTCWTVFHLHCIKKWATNEGSAMAQQQAPNGEMPPPRQWRCPGCNLPKDSIPISANDHVTKVSAELVKFGYLLAATAGKLRKTSSAATVMMRRRASGLI